MNTMLNENGLTFKDFEKKTFEMICKLWQEYTRDFLERYDTYLMETRDKEAYRNKGKKKTTVKTVYGEVEYERRIYQVTREDGLTEFVFLLDEQLEISGVGLISMNMAEQMVSNITEMSYRETAEKITDMTGQKETNRCCCWAHIRRYLLDSIPKGMDKDYTNPAVQGFLYCEKLFAYERSYREKGLSHKQIYNRRLKDEKPVIEGFLSWLNQVNPGSNGKLKKAITYIKNREAFLMTYLEDGRCSFSNNLSENSIRPVTVGRKNWLFSDTPEGAQANTLYLTIVEMAKAYDLDLYQYLNFLFEQRPNKEMSDDELEKLAPWNESVKELCSIK